MAWLTVGAYVTEWRLSGVCLFYSPLHVRWSV